MKKFFSLIATASICASALLVGCGDKETVKNTVIVPVNERYELSNLFSGNDSLFNVRLCHAEGQELSIDGRKIIFTQLGEYTLTHADGEITKINVKDLVAPTISFDFNGYQPKAEQQTSLPLTVMDNYDGEKVNVTIFNSGIETVNSFKPTKNGAKLKVIAKDKSGNSSQSFVNLLPAGTKFTADKSLFDNLDEQKNYSISYKVTEYSNNRENTYLGNAATLKSNEYCKVTATAKCGTEIIIVNAYYIPMI